MEAPGAFPLLSLTRRCHADDSLARAQIEECITQSEVAAKSGRVLEVPSILLHDRVAREDSSPSEVESGSLSPEAEVKAEDEWW